MYGNPELADKAVTTSTGKVPSASLENLLPLVIRARDRAVPKLDCHRRRYGVGSSVFHPRADAAMECLAGIRRLAAVRADRGLRCFQVPVGATHHGLSAGGFLLGGGFNLLSGEVLKVTNIFADIAVALVVYQLGRYVDIGWLRREKWLMITWPSRRCVSASSASR
jgi:hypothetical protein